jgi:hypothetical protein
MERGMYNVLHDCSKGERVTAITSCTLAQLRIGKPPGTRVGIHARVWRARSVEGKIYLSPGPEIAAAENSRTACGLHRLAANIPLHMAQSSGSRSLAQMKRDCHVQIHLEDL